MVWLRLWRDTRAPNRSAAQLRRDVEQEDDVAARRRREHAPQLLGAEPAGPERRGPHRLERPFLQELEAGTAVRPAHQMAGGQPLGAQGHRIAGVVLAAREHQAEPARGVPGVVEDGAQAVTGPAYDAQPLRGVGGHTPVHHRARDSLGHRQPAQRVRQGRLAGTGQPGQLDDEGAGWRRRTWCPACRARASWTICTCSPTGVSVVMMRRTSAPWREDVGDEVAAAPFRMARYCWSLAGGRSTARCCLSRSRTRRASVALSASRIAARSSSPAVSRAPAPPPHVARRPVAQLEHPDEGVRRALVEHHGRRARRQPDVRDAGGRGEPSRPGGPAQPVHVVRRGDRDRPRAGDGPGERRQVRAPVVLHDGHAVDLRERLGEGGLPMPGHPAARRRSPRRCPFTAAPRRPGESWRARRPGASSRPGRRRACRTSPRRGPRCSWRGRSRSPRRTCGRPPPRGRSAGRPGIREERSGRRPVARRARSATSWTRTRPVSAASRWSVARPSA